MAEAVQALWIGSELSTIESLCLASFVHHGSEVDLYSYVSLDVPEGVTLKDANAIVPETEVLTLHGGSYGFFSDYFRWELLRTKGGIWIDTDVLCMRPFEFDEPMVFGKEGDSLVNGAVIKFPAGHDMAVYMSNRCSTWLRSYADRKTYKKMLSRVSRRVGHDLYPMPGWGEIGGPKAVTAALHRFGLWHLAKPFTWFYPIHYSSWRSVIDDTFAENDRMFPDTYAVHLWNEMMRREGFDKNGPLDEISLLGRLRKDYLRQ